MLRRLVLPVLLVVVVAVLGGCDSTDERACCLPHGAIGARYIAIGGEDGPLGGCTGQESGRDGGQVQDFANGAMFWTEETGAWEVYGQIGAKYTEIGGPTSAVGWPVSGELITPNGVGRFNRFEQGNIYFAPTGTHPVYGAIFAEWGRQGFENGRFGFPTSDEFDIPGGRQTNFEGGWIRWIADGDQVLTS
ncbi:LGFP repeat-containing protein [Rhodococcus sp. NM-2]|uniref:LGFP repeat-containing protein n=1 Tax=Rhodococcus sp. NM-2 TaxID=3401174 RepID=UPI003AAAA870